MTTFFDVVAAVCMITGSLLALVAAIGQVRMPDLLSRTHPATKPQVLGLGLVLLGVALRLREPEAFGLLALVIIFQLVTSPVASHMIGRAAVRTDNRGEERLVVDELSEDRPQGRADEGDVPDQR